MIRRHVFIAAVVIALAGAATEAQAQGPGPSIGPLVGLNFDIEEIYIGAEGWIPLEGVEVGDNTVILNPAFVFYPFVGSTVDGTDIDQTIWGISADAMIPFDMGGDATPFVKGGLAILRTSTDDITVGGVTVEGDSNTDAFLDLAAGSTFGPQDAGKFYGQVGVLIGNGSSVYLQGGYQFIF